MQMAASKQSLRSSILYNSIGRTYSSGFAESAEYSCIQEALPESVY